MPKFVVAPHFRLQEWVAEEKGYFAAEGLGDFDLAERLLQRAVTQMPETPVYRFNLIQVLLHNGKQEAASAQIAALRAQNHLGVQRIAPR